MEFLCNPSMCRCTVVLLLSTLSYLLVMSYTTTATLESRMYEGMRERNLSCPAVSQSCSRTVLSSKYIVLERKSIPIVAFKGVVGNNSTGGERGSKRKMRGGEGGGEGTAPR